MFLILLLDCGAMLPAAAYRNNKVLIQYITKIQFLISPSLLRCLSPQPKQSPSHPHHAHHQTPQSLPHHPTSHSHAHNRQSERL